LWKIRDKFVDFILGFTSNEFMVETLIYNEVLLPVLRYLRN
jgi:hypothetical protein